MMIRSLVSAALIAVAIPAVALAATTKPTTPKPAPDARCMSLETQFTDAVKANDTAAKPVAAATLAKAQKLADDGTKLCTDKKYSSGERKLIAALKDLGVTPKTT
jgi:hypothetical protein